MREIAAVKTGMLATGDIVRVVAETVAAVPYPQPRRRSRYGRDQFRGRTLLEPEAVSILMTHLLPRATVVTPNIAEAEVLSGVQIDSLTAARTRPGASSNLGRRPSSSRVVIWAGPSPPTCCCTRAGLQNFRAPRVEFADLHGTGCTFASAIAARSRTGRRYPGGG